MAYTYHELKEKNIGELREIAKDVEHEAVKGYTQLNKDHLLVALCKALNISTHEHHAVGGFDKSATKAKMRDLRVKRTAALDAHDHAALKSIRRQLHALNHDIRSHTVED
jgi:DNA-binding IclR family transcriptional regulator